MELRPRVFPFEDCQLLSQSGQQCGYALYRVSTHTSKHKLN
jgi:hypothetical protein